MTFRRDRKTVPDTIDLLGVELHLLGVPVDRLELQFHTETGTNLTGKINIVADDFVFVVAESHRGKGIIEAEDKRLASWLPRAGG